ncbi:MAG: hypothetical protein KBF37_09090 [Saprospiraceae bacterium]|jgi:hypothetical protein|nr:hypothetical protein [Saprospiraceae bacterium]MBP9210461.1 hypothetical protein [Saprospiraceae bacterium]MBV6474156.1 hypothetical protein [Saprospiraceae bacterium]
MNALNKVFTLWGISVLMACGAPSASQEGEGDLQHIDQGVTAEGDRNTNSQKPTAKYLRLKRYDIVDRQGTGLVAVSCLIPEHWQVRDQVFWDYQDATQPLRYQGLFQDPGGALAVQIYPDVRSVYSQGPMGTSGYPPPRDVQSALRDFIGQQRGQTGFRVVDSKVVAQSGPRDNYISGTYFQTTTQSGFMRIAYNDHQGPVEEEFYAQLELTNSLSQGVVALGGVIWSFHGIYSCKAPQGKLENSRQIAMTLKSSSKLNLPFYNRYMQLVQFLSDESYRRIFAAGEVSRIFSQTSAQISQSITDSYWQTQRAYERSNTQFSDYLRGVDRYQDGQSQVQLPSGYSNAWVNDRGEYLLTETQAFDPNHQLDGNWRALQRR